MAEDAVLRRESPAFGVRIYGCAAYGLTGLGAAAIDVVKRKKLMRRYVAARTRAAGPVPFKHSQP